MSDTTVTKRYATALHESVAGSGAEAVRGLKEQLRQMAAALEVPDLRRLADNPRLTPEQKLGVLLAVGEKVGLSGPGQNLLKVLVHNGRGLLLGHVAEAFAELVDAAEGRLPVTVTSAVTLPGEAAASVDSRLREILGAEADIAHRVDAGIIGGLVVRIGSQVFDHSVRYQLARLRQTL
ncbi:MAG: ATP synthase F1 subunit delta [Nitrospirota bacterium]|nr:ATP synthase F1 subunit delta [Nitrospirota bacterium]